MPRFAFLLLASTLAACNGSSDSSHPPDPPPVLEDEPPTLTFAEPLDETVATPEVRVTASCTDDRGECTLSLAVDDSFSDTLTFAELGSEVSREFGLSVFDGKTVTVTVIAVDSAGQSASLGRRVYVEGSAHLVNERVFPLPVIDFDGERALLQIDNDLTIVEAPSGLEENVEVSKFFVIQDAHLTPTGAAYAGLVEDGAEARAYDWNHALRVELGTSGSIEVAGDYGVWHDEITSALVRRQFSTMTDLHVRDFVSDGSVASNGVVVFAERESFDARDQIVKFDEGVYTTLTTDADRDNRSPKTDGQGVVYYKSSHDDVFDHDVYEIAFHDGTGETILTDPRSGFLDPDIDYAIAGGWVAFTEIGGLGKTNVWTRDPSGTLLERAAFDVDILVETLAPDGEVMVLTTELHTLGKSSGIARYLSRPTGELTKIGSASGWSKRIGDTWYVAIGRSVFEVE